MNEVKLTQHAITRMAQRAVHDDDIDLVMMIGTAVEDGYLVRVRDCQAAERELKGLLQRVRRLSGLRLVVDGSQVLTAYRARQSTERRLMRRAEGREFAGSR